jgi:hypothetical protein
MGVGYTTHRFQVMDVIETQSSRRFS